LRRGAVLLTALLLAACAGGGGGGGGKGGGGACKPPATPTICFATNIQPIFDRSCAQAGCHSGAVPAQALDLSAGRSLQQIVGVKSTEVLRLFRVKPGAPDQSYLVQKIENAPGIAGVLMPQGCPGNPLQGAQCLSADDVAAIRTWITECATSKCGA
jgi:hypothetical protein